MKSWKTLLSHRVRRQTDAQDALPVQIDTLFAQQSQEWPLLRKNLSQLAEVEITPLKLGDFEIRAQYNPGRLHNTTANMDPAAIAQRSCKLCPENLFPEQRGIDYREKLVVLCNPFPIVPRHLTIVDRHHRPQAIAGRLSLLLNLAQDLAGRFAIFYNGPRCGASTPEHFHVQACLREDVPILSHHDRLEQETVLHHHKHSIQQHNGCEIFTLSDYHVSVIVYQGDNRQALLTDIQRTLDRFAALSEADTEPLINILMVFEHSRWRIYLFPRAVHRPASYFDQTFVVSPATLDMAGCLVIPMPEHFQAVSVERVRQVYNEVSLPSASLAQILIMND